MGSDVTQANPSVGTEMTGDPDLDWLTLDEDEEIKWASTPHKYSILPAVLISLPLLFILIGFITLPAAYLGYTNTSYVITTKGVYSKKGILSESVKQVELNKIQNTSYSEDVIGGALGYGNVSISTAGGSGVELTFRSVPEPRGVRQLVSKLADDAKGTDTTDGETKADVLDDILNELREIRTSLNDQSNTTTHRGTTKHRNTNESDTYTETNDVNTHTQTGDPTATDSDDY